MVEVHDEQATVIVAATGGVLRRAGGHLKPAVNSNRFES
jgi:hypothetical protein